jgi:hypothetical protein
MRKVRFPNPATAALVAALTLAAAPGLVFAGDTHPISDGAAKGQASEGTYQPSSGALTGRRMHHPYRRKLPGKMKSGTLTVTHAPTAGGGATTSGHSNSMMGNHKD